MKDLDSVKKAILSFKGLGFFLKEDKYIDMNGQEEQLSCPFHGKDNKPSARYYAETDTMYCWTCQKRWDVFGYLGEKKDYDFGSSVKFLVQKFGIDTSAMPDIEERVKRPDLNKSEKKINRKSILLLKMEDRVVSLRQKIPFVKYNSLAFKLVVLKSNEDSESFTSDCELLIKEIKDIG